MNSDVFGFGSYQWRVTFRSDLGDLPMLGVDTRLLTGSDARATVAEVNDSCVIFIVSIFFIFS